MRDTIIGIFGGIVLLVTLLSFAFMRLTLGDISNKGEAQRAVTAAVAQFEVEGLRIERWLYAQADSDKLRQPFEASTAAGANDTAVAAANAIEQAAKGAEPFARIKPLLVVIFDPKGVVVGRNGSKRMQGDKLGDRYPVVVSTIQAGSTGSSVWVNEPTAEQMLASFAPIRDANRKIIGGIAIGTNLNDERLQSASAATSTRALILTVPGGDAMRAVAKSNGVLDDMLGAVTSSQQALGGAQAVSLSGLGPQYEGAGLALLGYGDGKQAAVLAVTELQSIGRFTTMIWAALGALLVGLILTVVSAHMIDNYLSQPISDVEEGLLAIINGDTEIRFELEHKVLGGLVFRLNSLLNQLLGVREDDTDAEGRPAHAPSATTFGAALHVDERMISLTADDVADAGALKDEAAEDYYKRIFDEYTAAKRELGDPVEHVKFTQFEQRIKASEREMTQKHAKPVRFKIEVKGKEVTLVAVPLE
ncbi:MAG: hypothetical protein EXR75_14215 [Myxococcales bacterium]|nr:hypothetical protein [Myxococcales bacterium]